MKPIDASAPTHVNIVKPSPVLPDRHNFARVIGDVNPRTKLVAETLPSQPTKEELLNPSIDKTLGASTANGPTLVTVCADVQNYDNMNDSDDERLIIDELRDTASIDSEEAVTRMHVFRDTLSNFFPVQDLAPPPPTPSISLTSPSMSRLASPAPSETSQISAMTGNLIAGEKCFPPVKRAPQLTHTVSKPPPFPKETFCPSESTSQTTMLPPS